MYHSKSLPFAEVWTPNATFRYVCCSELFSERKFRQCLAALTWLNVIISRESLAPKAADSRSARPHGFWTIAQNVWVLHSLKHGWCWHHKPRTSLPQRDIFSPPRPVDAADAQKMMIMVIADLYWFATLPHAPLVGLQCSAGNLRYLIYPARSTCGVCWSLTRSTGIQCIQLTLTARSDQQCTETDVVCNWPSRRDIFGNPWGCERFISTSTSSTSSNYIKSTLHHCKYLRGKSTRRRCKRAFQGP